jgi:hypothetical protein
MNPSIRSGGTMALMLTSSFDMSYFPQPSFTTGGWNLPSYGSNLGYALSGANTQMGAYSTYYTPSMYPPSAMSVPLNTFFHGKSSLLSLKFRPQMVTRIQHRQIVMRSPMDQNYHKSISKGSKTIQPVTKLKCAMDTLGARAHA